VYLAAKGGYSFVPTLDADESTWLEREFEEHEVWEVVRGLNFFQKCWEVVKKDILVVFLEFHSQRLFEKSFNATFVSLIPKKTSVVDLKDFRPISLVGGVYKIISRVIADRFKSVLGKIISNSQNAFIGGRQVLDSVLIDNECLDSRLRSGGI
jgi:hypothetical protein